MNFFPPLGFLPTLMLIIFTICMLVLVVLWLQSGMDKITDYKGNLDWLKGHFSKSFLKGMVPVLLISLTILELSSGLLSFLSILEVWFLKTWRLPVYACALSLFTFFSLFTGQRLAKDYAGAASLMGYMIFTTILMLVVVYASMLSLMSHWKPFGI